MDRRQKTWSLIVLVPALVSTALFVYGFVAWTGWASLTDWNQMRRVSGFLPPGSVTGLDNYEAIFATPRFWTNDVFNNVVFTFVFVVGAVVAGLLLAILIDQRIRGESILRSIFLLPMALSFVVTGTIWAWILNPTSGLNVLIEGTVIDDLRRVLLEVPLLQPLWGVLDDLRINVLRPGMTADPRAVIGAIAVAAVWQMSGFVMALYLAGLRAINDELREAARVDGASEARLYRHIVIPLLRPITVSAIVLLGYVSLKMFDLVFVLTRGGPALSSDLPSIFMFDTTFRSQAFAQGAAVATIMFIVSAVVIVPYLWAQLRQRPT
ncbi:MAG TPA: sugar ABC transporter permease [Candidatus Limnocylindrales bacterium]|nr:sugar ABC transporter permease [Candidatus Limnocylindrales bacterium]